VSGTADGPRADRWPGRLVELDSHPSDVAPPWAEHVQGIAAGPGAWFVTQDDHVWRFAMDRDLSELDRGHPDVLAVPMVEPGVTHLGDCDFSDGLLYVAMEGTSPARVGVFDHGLRYRGSAPVEAQGDSCPWCAINPVDGLLYSSRFDADRLLVYRRRWKRSGRGALDLEHVGDVWLTSEDGVRLGLDRVQGGAFSPHGHLYLTGDTAEGGVFGIDATSGQRVLHAVIPYQPGWPEHEVVEGLTVLDLSDGSVPWMRGQLHVLVFNADEDRPDLVWLRHFGFWRE
jgi:hypothetical protein